MLTTRTLVIATLALLATALGATADEGKVEYLSPDGLHKNPAYSQAVVATGNVKTVYVGGQNAVDTAGKIVGKGDLKLQTAKTIENVETALRAGGAKLERVVKWNVHILQGQPIADGAKVFQEKWGKRPNPPTVTVLVVPALGNPDFLVEIDAIAVVP
jgi:enamine deaminase RidA (YjgF/YER057c/UK114 family)